jgi:hypothetical protein
MKQVCKSVCPSASHCLAHQISTNTTYRNHELIEGEPELMKDGNKDCPLFWDANEEKEND